MRIRFGIAADGDAVEGFMTDIPALMIVIMAVSLFLVATISGYSMVSSNEAETRETERAEETLDLFCNFGPILVDGLEGHISAEAMDAIDMDGDPELLQEGIDLDPRMRIDVVILTAGPDGNPTETGTWQFNEDGRPEGSGRVLATRPVLIADEGGAEDTYGNIMFSIGEVRAVA